jgi:hypothetical protein
VGLQIFGKLRRSDTSEYSSVGWIAWLGTRTNIALMGAKDKNGNSTRGWDVMIVREGSKPYKIGRVWPPKKEGSKAVAVGTVYVPISIWIIVLPTRGGDDWTVFARDGEEEKDQNKSRPATGQGFGQGGGGGNSWDQPQGPQQGPQGDPGPWGEGASPQPKSASPQPQQKPSPDAFDNQGDPGDWQ